MYNRIQARCKEIYQTNGRGKTSHIKPGVYPTYNLSLDFRGYWARDGRHQLCYIIIRGAHSTLYIITLRSQFLILYYHLLSIVYLTLCLHNNNYMFVTYTCTATNMPRNATIRRVNSKYNKIKKKSDRRLETAVVNLCTRGFIPGNLVLTI